VTEGRLVQHSYTQELKWLRKITPGVVVRVEMKEEGKSMRGERQQAESRYIPRRQRNVYERFRG
jgi:hypothetical protein